MADILLNHEHDLIHKAVGWMLREVGKKDQVVLESFLRDNYDELSRTTLRYAIERFGEGERKGWLRGNICSNGQSSLTSHEASHLLSQTGYS